MKLSFMTLDHVRQSVDQADFPPGVTEIQVGGRKYSVSHRERQVEPDTKNFFDSKQPSTTEEAMSLQMILFKPAHSTEGVSGGSSSSGHPGSGAGAAPSSSFGGFMGGASGASAHARAQYGGQAPSSRRAKPFPHRLKIPALSQQIPTETEILAYDVKNYNIIKQVAQSDSTGILLGCGAFGYVKAVKISLTQGDESLEQDFAIKVNKDLNTFDYLKQEAQTARKINHPRIVQYLGIAIEKQGSNEVKIKIVMELMQGSLTDLAAQDLSVQKKLLLLRDIAEGLVYLHQRGLVHNDIKRDNILFDKQGRAVIGDLGRVATYTEFCDDASSLVPPEMLGFHSVQLERAKAWQSSLMADRPVDEWSGLSRSGANSSYGGEEPGLDQPEPTSVEHCVGKTDIYGLAYIAMQLFMEKTQIAVWKNTYGDEISTIAPELESYRQQHFDNPVALETLEKLILPGLRLERDNRPSAKETVKIIDKLLEYKESGSA